MSPQPSPEALVAISGLTKRFGATLALKGVDLTVVSGRVLALLGANGAGKSTVIKILAGVHTADSGSVLVGGDPLGSAAAHGRLAFVHQDLGLVDELSVAENVALGTGFPRSRGLISWSSVNERAKDALERVGLDLDPRTTVGDLSRTERSLVAIGRALAAEASVLVLDEPTASLPVDETGRLFTVLRDLRERGLGLVYVSHRLDEVFEIADDVVVLRDGQVVAEGPLAGMSSDQVVAHIVGTHPLEQTEQGGQVAMAGGTEAALELRGVVGERVGPVSLAVAPGEVVGLVGLAGAGMVELGRTVAGALPLHRGEILVGGRVQRVRSVRDAVAQGIVFVTSNRLEEGLGPSLTVTENFLPNPRARGAGPLTAIRHGREREQARQLGATFGVQPGDPDLLVTALSGGNQQKVILGRWLSTDATVLVLEEPSAGVDVGAKRELYRLLDQALARGAGVLLVSTDVEEVVGVCSRALVFRDGLATEEIPRADLTVEVLTALSTGAGAAA